MVAYEKNIEGEIVEGSYKDVNINDFILCRNNLPLLQLYLQLIIDEKPCIIKGKDLGESLLKLLSKISSNDIYNAKQQLKDLLLKTEEQLKEKNINYVNKHPKYIELQEKIQILYLLIDKFGSINKTKKVMSEIFSDKTTNKIVLSTIHKAKGLEADTVFFLRPELIPFKYAEQQWELIQEKNLYYVMLTRAKKKIVIINDF
jgi:superfamily I DNA/RNA helicase